RKRGSGVQEWTTLGLGVHTKRRSGALLPKLQQQLTDDVRRAFEQAPPSDLLAFDLKKGTRLERVRVEITLGMAAGRRKVSGRVPLILEPRRTGGDVPLVIVYHPARQHEWFPFDPMQALAPLAEVFLQQAWSGLDGDEVQDLWSDGKDLITVLAFSGRPHSL